MKLSRIHSRRAELREQYHPFGCQCSGCSNLKLQDELSNQFRRIPPSVVDEFLDDLHAGRLDRNGVHQNLTREYYKRLRQFAEAGYGRSFTQARSKAEFLIMEQMKQNLSFFAASKSNTAAEELRDFLQMPRKDFKAVGQQVMDRFNYTWLDAELSTASQAAQSAENWKHFLDRADLYPNLRYVTAGDERVRQEHASLDGKVYPVNDPFWDVYMPPNGYRCRCKALQTDEPVDRGEAGFNPPNGFRNNPGKTGRLFEQDHPYFKLGERKDQVRKLGEEIRSVYEAGEVLSTAADLYAGSVLPIPQLATDMQVSRKGLQSVINSAHSEPAFRNDLLTGLSFFLEDLQEFSEGSEKLILILEVLDVEFFLQLEGDNYLLTAITDRT